MEKPEWLSRMETVLEVLNEGVVIADDHHRILFVNSRFVEMTGISPEKLVGFDASHFYSSQEWDVLTQQIEVAFRTGHNRYSFVLPRKDGSRLPVIISSRTLQTSGSRLGIVTFTDIGHSPDVVGVKRAYFWAARLDHLGMGLLRLGLVIVLLWIGGLKFASYEADGIVPLVANSPFGSFLYHHRPPEYRHYMNKEGELVPAYQQWQKSNGTYPVSYGLGVIIVGLGLLIALHPVRPQFSAVGSLLLIGMCFVTLSFLVTTPEAWVPALGDVHHGFPFLSGAGRLIIKDAIMLGAAVTTLADSAKAYVAQLEFSHHIPSPSARDISN